MKEGYHTVGKQTNLFKTNLLGGLSAELEAGLDGGWAGDLDLAFSEALGPGFEGTSGLMAWSAWFFLGLLEDSDVTVA